MGKSGQFDAKLGGQQCTDAPESNRSVRSSGIKLAMRFSARSGSSKLRLLSVMKASFVCASVAIKVAMKKPAIPGLDPVGNEFEVALCEAAHPLSSPGAPEVVTALTAVDGMLPALLSAVSY